MASQVQTEIVRVCKEKLVSIVQQLYTSWNRSDNSLIDMQCISCLNLWTMRINRKCFDFTLPSLYVLYIFISEYFYISLGHFSFVSDIISHQFSNIATKLDSPTPQTSCNELEEFSKPGPSFSYSLHLFICNIYKIQTVRKFDIYTIYISSSLCTQTDLEQGTFYITVLLEGSRVSAESNLLEVPIGSSKKGISTLQKLIYLKENSIKRRR